MGQIVPQLETATESAARTRFLARHLLDLDEALRLSQCIECGARATLCPNGVPSCECCFLAVRSAQRVVSR